MGPFLIFLIPGLGQLVMEGQGVGLSTYLVVRELTSLHPFLECRAPLISLNTQPLPLS